jgi:hypothetical protein
MSILLKDRPVTEKRNQRSLFYLQMGWVDEKKDYSFDAIVEDQPLLETLRLLYIAALEGSLNFDPNSSTDPFQIQV